MIENVEEDKPIVLDFPAFYFLHFSKISSSFPHFFSAAIGSAVLLILSSRSLDFFFVIHTRG